MNAKHTHDNMTVNPMTLVNAYIGPMSGDFLRKREADAFNALVAYYIDRGFSPPQAEWAAENDRAAKDRCWKQALEGKLI